MDLCRKLLPHQWQFKLNAVMDDSRGNPPARPSFQPDKPGVGHGLERAGEI